MRSGFESLPATLELFGSVHHVPPVVGRDTCLVHLVNQALEIREGGDGRSLSIIDQSDIFTGNSQVNRTLGALQGNSTAVPVGRQSLVGRGKGTRNTAMTQKKLPDGGNIGVRIIGLGFGLVALVGPEAFPDLEEARRMQTADPGAHQLMDAEFDLAFRLL
jgi:hypothetical protein